jgi:hypothetical protein
VEDLERTILPQVVEELCSISLPSIAHAGQTQQKASLPAGGRRFFLLFA